jgi:hypothetical protein
MTLLKYNRDFFFAASVFDSELQLSVPPYNLLPGKLAAKYENSMSATVT